MKKLFALLAVALGVVACQKDQADFGVNLGGEQEVTINVALSAETRASSALGSLDNDVLKAHDLRYTLEIYQGDHCLRMEKFTTEDNVAFPVRLAPGREYKFAVWADFVKKEGEDAHKDLYYTTSLGLKNIMLNKVGTMDEARDAFYGKATLAADANLASLSTITLTRPFAKVRVVATDIEDVRKFGIEPKKATVTYTVALPTKFNAVEGAASTAQTLQAIPYDIVNNAYSDAAGQLTVFADYIFVPENGSISFNLDVKDGSDVRIKENNFSTAIPVAVNKVTSIVGDVLTDSKDLDININDKFDAETIYLEGDVTLTEDLNVNRPLVVAAGKTAVLNLNGKKIINTNPSENFGEGEGIVVYGNLTIEGEGTIQGTSMAVWARGNDNAVVTIKGGTFVGCQEGLAKGGRSVIYASSGNVVNIYGGEFKAEAADETSFAATQYPVLNVADNNGMINVYGGRFYKQNPAAPGTEPAAWNANHPNGFVANGYVSVADGDWFEVVKLTKNEVKSILSDAVAAGETNIVIDAGNENIGDLNGGLTKTLVPAGTTLTIRNATIEGRSYGNKIDGDVIFEKCVFTHTGAYSIHFDGGQGSVAFKECELYGWNSFGSTLKSVSFEDCSLKGNGTYALIRSYVDMTLTNCTIDLSNANHADEWPEGVEIASDAVGKKLEETNTVYEISSKAGMFWFANEVNVNGKSFSGKTVKLAADINLENAEWTPVGQTGGYGIATYFKGVFDGNNKTINNLKITTTNAGKNYAAGLFGFIDAGAAEIKNLTIDGATVNGHHWTGVINGYLTGKITNCTVKNATVICSHANDDACGDKASTIVGYINSGKVSNCHAEKCVVKAGRDAGQIVGAAKAEYVENCTATNVTVSANGDCTGANIRNEVIGRLL